jgi:magnesium-transporting ATPase (P-type)
VPGPLLREGEGSYGIVRKDVLMSTLPASICLRCNKPTGDTEKCSKCGTPLKSLASQQRRGWVSFSAGVFLVVFMAAIWIWVDGLLASAPRDPGLAQFQGRLNIAFALIVIAGALGGINGWLMARTGIRNRVLIVGLIVVFISALFVACSASNAYHPLSS